MPAVAVLGGGSWATALVKLLSERADRVHWWMRHAESVAHIRQFGHNPRYLSDVELNLQKIEPSDSLADVIAAADILVLAVPAAFLKAALHGVEPGHLQNKRIFSAIKGIVPQDNLIVGEFMHSTYGIPFGQIGVISGPCHAEEVALEKLSYLTIACQDQDNAREMADLLSGRFIRTICSDDIYGTEYAAVLKNVMAIASGICHGLGYGDNFQAVLISNAIREIKRFVDAVHPIFRDINDSAYLGDLLVTAYSQFSRNRTFGTMIGKGYSVKSAQVEMNMVAEGYYAIACIHEMNRKLNIDLPICSAVYNILYERITPKVEMRILAEKLS
jgi:glycerol-3-phosphate dehydrogenase (NAD(P)+)